MRNAELGTSKGRGQRHWNWEGGMRNAELLKAEDRRLRTEDREQGTEG
jgi:hypothetical protein